MTAATRQGDGFRQREGYLVALSLLSILLTPLSALVFGLAWRAFRWAAGW